MYRLKKSEILLRVVVNHSRQILLFKYKFPQMFSTPAEEKYKVGIFGYNVFDEQTYNKDEGIDYYEVRDKEMDPKRITDKDNTYIDLHVAKIAFYQIANKVYNDEIEEAKTKLTGLVLDLNSKLYEISKQLHELR